MEATTSTASAEGVRPFTIDFPDEQIEDLRARLEATRWPGKEIVADASQGVQLEPSHELIRYWDSDYDMSRLEDRLNAVPQFITEIDGVDIHFIHVKSRHEDALPLIITHGWPGSVVELLEVVGPHSCRRRGRAGAARGLGPGGLHGVPRRDLPGAAQLGRAGLSHPHLLQRGRQGRSLRRLGGARDLR